MASDSPAESPVEKKDTRRIVLRRAVVVELPYDVTDEQLEAIGAALAPKKGKPKKATPETGWFVIPGEFEGASKEKSIYAYTGPPGLPDTIVGAFKAVPATAWKDGVLNAAPPKPLVQSTRLED